MEQLTSNIEYSQINTKHFQGRNSLMCLSITEKTVLVLLLKILTNREEVDCETVNLPLSIVRAAAFLYLPMPYFCSLTSSEHLTPVSGRQGWHSVISSPYILILYVLSNPKCIPPLFLRSVVCGARGPESLPGCGMKQVMSLTMDHLVCLIYFSCHCSVPSK